MLFNYMKNFLLTAYSALVCEVLSFDSDLTIKTPQGTLVGTINSSRNGNPFLAYLGIPYAEPPVNNLRFKPPVPSKGWQGVRYFTKDASACVQDNLKQNSSVEGQEDCLYLNVFVPKCSSQGPLPVMVYFHGGGFFSGNGSSKFYGPQYFMDHGIVLVTIQYRLGVLGFMSFGNRQMPGNVGLKDQVLALKWVRENIAYFGGNSSSVTIFGGSCGAASVNLHLVSPLSIGLFDRAIQQSGTYISPKFLIAQDVAKNYAHKVAKFVGCSYKAGEELLKCLQNVSVKDLNDASDSLLVFDIYPEPRFLPVIEPATSELNFLPCAPLLLPVKNIPVILGVNFKEGALYAAPFCAKNYEAAEKLNQDLLHRLPLFLNFNSLKSEPQVELARRVEDFYLGNQPVTRANFDGLIDMYSDFLYFHPALLSARHLAYYAPVYFYVYNYKLLYSLTQIITGCSKRFGVAHRDELFVFFQLPYPQATLRPQDVAFSNQMIELWTTFARDGVPGNSKWRPTQSPSIDYFLMDNEGFSLKTGFFPERMKFGDNLTSLLPDIYSSQLMGDKGKNSCLPLNYSNKSSYLVN